DWRMSFLVSSSDSDASDRDVVNPEVAAFPAGPARFPLWVIHLPVGGHHVQPPDMLIRLLYRLDKRLHGCAFRGVGIDRLPTVLQNGIDAEPTTAPIFVDGFGKAWEYGDWPKIVLGLSWKFLDHTYREVPATTPDAELASLRELYPTMLRRPDGK